MKIDIGRHSILAQSAVAKYKKDAKQILEILIYHNENITYHSCKKLIAEQAGFNSEQEYTQLLLSSNDQLVQKYKQEQYDSLVHS